MYTRLYGFLKLGELNRNDALMIILTFFAAEGQHCVAVGFGAPPLMGICGDGLECVNGTCTVDN